MRKSDERLRHQLEVQSIQIEEFLNRHQVSAEVAGGTVRSRWVSFDLNTQLAAGIDKIRGLGQELASTLGASDVSITQYDDRLRIAVKQADNHPVDLLDLMDALPDMAPMTAALGLDDADRPVLLNLLAEDIVNILVAGGPEAGKTALLRTFALSLALQNRQSQIQMAILDVQANNKGQQRKPSLYPLNYLPHVMFTVVETLREAAEALNFLVTEVEYRIEQEVMSPLLVLMIDDADKLVEMGGLPIIEPLAYLLEEGVSAGMRIILGASNPNSNAIRPLIKNSFPTRLVGRVGGASAARATTGIADSRAEYLQGQGDFVAVSNGTVLPFQAAFITDYDLHLLLDKLHRQSQPVMLARPLSVRPSLDDGEEEPDEPQYFEFNSQNRRARLEPPAEVAQNGKSPRVIEPNIRTTIIPANKDEEIETIEDGDWEEIEDDNVEWEGDEKEETVIDIWAGYRETYNDVPEEEGWGAEEADDDDPGMDITIWSSGSVPSTNNNRTITRLDPDEIAFDWD
jgi:DNA segregation ATPase FtsK/SpoIIIE-like protein